MSRPQTGERCAPDAHRVHVWHGRVLSLSANGRVFVTMDPGICVLCGEPFLCVARPWDPCTHAHVTADMVLDESQVGPRCTCYSTQGGPDYCEVHAT